MTCRAYQSWGGPTKYASRHAAIAKKKARSAPVCVDPKRGGSLLAIQTFSSLAINPSRRISARHSCCVGIVFVSFVVSAVGLDFPVSIRSTHLAGFFSSLFRFCYVCMYVMLCSLCSFSCVLTTHHHLALLSFSSPPLAGADILLVLRVERRDHGDRRL